MREIIRGAALIRQQVGARPQISKASPAAVRPVEAPVQEAARDIAVLQRAIDKTKKRLLRAKREGKATPSNLRKEVRSLENAQRAQVAATGSMADKFDASGYLQLLQQQSDMRARGERELRKANGLVHTRNRLQHQLKVPVASEPYSPGMSRATADHLSASWLTFLRASSTSRSAGSSTS